MEKNCSHFDVAASVIFEFYEENNKYFVEVLYNNDPIYVCHEKTNCTYDEFLKKLQDSVLNLDDYELVK